MKSEEHFGWSRQGLQSRCKGMAHNTEAYFFSSVGAELHAAKMGLHRDSACLQWRDTSQIVHS